MLGEIVKGITAVGNVSGIIGSKTLATLVGVNNDQLKEILDTANTQPSLCYVPIQAESISKRRQVDVSNTMLISQVTQAKNFVTDNSAPHPRIWEIRGYLKALSPTVENGLLIKPTLVVQEAILDAAAESRQRVKLKTDTGEVVDVLIKDLQTGSTPKGENVRTISVVVQEASVLTNSVASNLNLDAVGAASVPAMAVRNLGRNNAMLGAGIVTTLDLLKKDFYKPEVTVSDVEASVDTTVPDEERVASPDFDIPTGEINTGTRITLTCTTEGATILYTLDGTEPHIGSTEYTEPIILDINTLSSSNVIIKAKAYKSGMVYSSVAYRRYKIIEPVIPVLGEVMSNHASGIVDSGTVIELSSTDTEATIVYTLDGSNPGFGSTVYTRPFVMGGSVTELKIKAMAVHNGRINSPVAEFNYTLNGQ